MLPTPSTSHVRFDTIYEPAEDSYLFLDTLSSSTETTWLSNRFNDSSSPTNSPPPAVLEVGTGSGVVLGFVAANAGFIFGRSDILTLGTDVNSNACLATQKTVQVALNEEIKTDERGNDENETIPSTSSSSPLPLAVMTADLCAPLRTGIVDVLIFNPPYVPTPDIPHIPSPSNTEQSKTGGLSKFEMESYLLSLSYAGGDCGMEITNRLLESVPQTLNTERGVAYILLCAQNKPDEVMARIRSWGSGWATEIVGRSGVKAGWERLVVIRIWKEHGL